MGNDAAVSKELIGNALLDELSRRIHCSDQAVMKAAHAEIIRLQAQVRLRGKLLADISNSDAVELPIDLSRRVDNVLMFCGDAQAASR